jgi:hypothetical protein
MERGPIVSREADQEWETWSEEGIPQNGLVFRKTLISKGVTRSENPTLGIANLPPAGRCASTGTPRRRSIWC